MLQPRPLGFLALIGLMASAPARAAEPGGGEPRVKLLAPGRPPLKALRYHPKSGQRGTTTVTMAMKTSLSLDGQPLPGAPTPQMRYTVRHQVTGLTPEGHIRYEFDLADFDAVADPAVPPPVLEATRQAIAGMNGLSGYAIVSTRGITQDAQFKLPPGAPDNVRTLLDSFRQSIQQLSAPLPEEPVGVGARWDTIHRLTQNGITVDQTGRHELTSLDGDQGRFSITLTQSAAPQPLALPGLPAESRVDLLSLSSTGDATTAFDLTALAPASATVKLKMLMKSRITVGQQKPQEMDMTMDMAMDLSTR